MKLLDSFHSYKNMYLQWCLSSENSPFVIITKIEYRTVIASVAKQTPPQRMRLLRGAPIYRGMNDCFENKSILSFLRKQESRIVNVGAHGHVPLLKGEQPFAPTTGNIMVHYFHALWCPPMADMTDSWEK